MPTKSTEPVATTRKAKDISQRDGMFTQMANSVGNSFESVGNTTKLLADGTDTLCELLQPIRVEARAETMLVSIQKIKELMAEGVSETDARNYIFYGRIA